MTITTISGASDGTEHTVDEFVVTVGAEMTRGDVVGYARW
jgi:hypothetical protein